MAMKTKLGEAGQSPAYLQQHFPSKGVCTAGAKAVGIKAEGSEIQGHGVAGGDKHWKRSLATEVDIYLDVRQNYRENAVK